MRNSIAFLIVFILSFVFFYQVQFSTPSIPGFDGYYHIKFASMIKTEGLISNFPWLWYTSWREHFVDLHFLYHLTLIPFTFLDLVYGAKLSTVFFFATLATLFSLVLKTARIPREWVWVTFLVIGSIAFLYRMALPRAPIAALAFMLLGWYFQAEKRYVSLTILSFLFVWLYGGFTIFLVLMGFLIGSEWIIHRVLDKKIIGSLLAGVACGLIINPFFPDNLNFIFTQTFQAGINREVIGGGEWSPYGVLDLMGSHKASALIFCLCITLYLSARAKPRPDTIGWFLFLIFTLVMTLNSRRFVEYFFPTLVISSALIFRDGLEEISIENKIKKLFQSPYMTVFLFFSLIAACSWQLGAAKNNLYDSRTPERYKAGAHWLKENTPGSLVYLTDWDDFPELFFYNSKNKYIIGLDPAFLFEYSESMYKKWIAINDGSIGEDPYPVFKDLFGTPFIFTDLHHGPLIKLLNQHPRIGLKYKDAHCRIYALE